MKKIAFLFIITIIFSFSGKVKNVYKGFNLKTFEKSLVIIPKGVLRISTCQNDACYYKYHLHTKQMNEPMGVCHMYSHEVSNGEYLEFLNDIKTDTILYTQMLSDSLVWRACGELFSRYYRGPGLYASDPYYSNYPVVGVSYEQAEHYCKWLTQKYMKEEKRKYKKVEFKLPTIAQWMYGAMGGQDDTDYPWVSNSHNLEGIYDKKGNLMANFSLIPQGNIRRKDANQCNGEQNLIADFCFKGTNNGTYDLTTPVFSYHPNNYGLYNMAGNVEEYVKEKGITKGGGWDDTGAYLKITTEEYYDSTNYTSAARGFRFIMEIKN
jgi:sulfatase modifying factor 1